jgi:hypothetical protein
VLLASAPDSGIGRGLSLSREPGPGRVRLPAIPHHNRYQCTETEPWWVCTSTTATSVPAAPGTQTSGNAGDQPIRQARIASKAARRTPVVACWRPVPTLSKTWSVVTTTAAPAGPNRPAYPQDWSASARGGGDRDRPDTSQRSSAWGHRGSSVPIAESRPPPCSAGRMMALHQGSGQCTQHEAEHDHPGSDPHPDPCPGHRHHEPQLSSPP